MRCKAWQKIPLRGGSCAAGAALWNKLQLLLRHKGRNTQMPFESFHLSMRTEPEIQPVSSKEESLFSLTSSFEILFSITLGSWVLGYCFCVEWSGDIPWQALPSVVLNQQDMKISLLCSWNLSGMPESDGALHPLGWTICYIETPMDSLDWKTALQDFCSHWGTGWHACEVPALRQGLLWIPSGFEGLHEQLGYCRISWGVLELQELW